MRPPSAFNRSARMRLKRPHQAGRRATDGVSEAQARAAGIANDLSDRAARTTDRMKAGLDAASETAKAKIEQVRSTVRDKATAAPETARQMIGDNAAVIAGLGVAIGAIIAASLPATRRRLRSSAMRVSA